MLKRPISIILSVLMLFSMFSCLDISAFAAETTTTATGGYSGSCGANVTYSYNSSTKTLTISGTGAMDDYSSSSDVPWYSYRDSFVQNWNQQQQ